jgi:hypothetical protein
MGIEKLLDMDPAGNDPHPEGCVARATPPAASPAAAC